MYPNNDGLFQLNNIPYHQTPITQKICGMKSILETFGEWYNHDIHSNGEVYSPARSCSYKYQEAVASYRYVMHQKLYSDLLITS